MGDPATRLDRRRLGEHRRRPAERELSQMYEMPVARQAVMCRIGAHRRDHDTVSEPGTADIERRKQRRGGSIG